MTQETEILSTVIGSLFGAALIIIGYFLKATMDRLQSVEKLSLATKSSHDLLKLDHSNKHESMSEKFDDLKESIVTLTKEIKELTSQIKR